MSEPETNPVPPEPPPRVVFVVSEDGDLALKHVDCLPRGFGILFPEHGLHPNRVLFSVIADIVMRLTDPSREPLVILTHSEALLSLVGDLIGHRRIDPEDIAVDLVRYDGTVARCRYSSEGYLRSPWPVGFFAPTTDAGRVWDAEVMRRKNASSSDA